MQGWIEIDGIGNSVLRDVVLPEGKGKKNGTCKSGNSHSVTCISSAFAWRAKEFDATSAAALAYKHTIPINAQAERERERPARMTAMIVVVSAVLFDVFTDPFMDRSHPPDLLRTSLTNPWGERLEYGACLAENFPQRVALAAEAYSRQGIRFDGYFGSSGDGRHYLTAADGEDGAYYGHAPSNGYRVVKDGVADDLKERVWICLDLPVHAVSLAGFPLREAMIADFAEGRAIYTHGGTFPENVPGSMWYFRRVRNLQLYFARKQMYSEQRITTEQYRDADFRPSEPFQVGDVLFFGHYGDADGRDGWWRGQHSGIVGTVDERGLPVAVYNMRVSTSLVDEYDGVINQTRPIAGEQKYFRRFSDRYSLIGFGRIVRPYEASAVDALFTPGFAAVVR